MLSELSDAVQKLKKPESILLENAVLHPLTFILGTRIAMLVRGKHLLVFVMQCAGDFWTDALPRPSFAL